MNKGSETQPILVIMAAGLGSRYGGLKQAEPVGPGGEILLEYAIFDALREGFSKVVFVVRQENEATFRDRVGRTVETRTDVAYVHQSLETDDVGVSRPAGRNKPWGTGHAVLSCRREADRPFAVINADDFYGRSTYRLLREELTRPGRGDDFCMVGFRIGNTLTDHGTVARGVCSVDPDGVLSGVVERTRIRRTEDGGVAYSEDGAAWVPVSPDTVVSLNTWGFTPALFPALESGFASFLRDPRTDLERSEFFLPTVVDRMVADGAVRVRVLPSRERWYGMTYREDAPVVRDALLRMVEQGLYPARLWET